MKDKFEEIKEFIEDMYEVKLFDFQEDMLMAMLSGDIYRAPRVCGRTMLLEGYKEYLSNKYSKHIPPEDGDIVVRGHRSRMCVIDDPIDFNTEYVSEWFGKLKE